MAEWMREEADGGLVEAQTALTKLKHKFKKNTDSFDECKTLLVSQVDQMMSARKKYLDARITNHMHNQLTIKELAAQRLQERPEKNEEDL